MSDVLDLRGPDGYPTEEALNRLPGFTGTPRQLVDALTQGMEAYGAVRVDQAENDFGKPVRVVYIATGGWSVPLVGALEAVLNLHQPEVHDIYLGKAVYGCTYCRRATDEWPCPSVAAVVDVYNTHRSKQ